MNRRSFTKALASLVVLPSLAWTGTKTLKAPSPLVGRYIKVCVPVFENFPVARFILEDELIPSHSIHYEQKIVYRWVEN